MLITNNEHDVILDSGERTEFPTGAVRDMRTGKGRCDLMPLDVVADIYCEVIDDCSICQVFNCLERFKETGSIKYLYDALISSQVMWGVDNMFLEVAVHFEDGAKKYGDSNWQKGIPVNCYIDSAVRHYLKYMRGDKDERHDRAFCWNIICAAWTCKHKPELNIYLKENVHE